MHSQNIRFANNTNADLFYVMSFLEEAYRTRMIPDEISDLFSLTYRNDLNPDGSLRIIINWA